MFDNLFEKIYHSKFWRIAFIVLVFVSVVTAISLQLMLSLAVASIFWAVLVKLIFWDLINAYQKLEPEIEDLEAYARDFTKTIELIASRKARVTSSADLTPEEVELAHKEKRIIVNEDGLGMVLIYN